MNSLELFSGAGGLAKGLELAGINHKGFIEWDKDACQTLRENFDASIIYEGDVRSYDFKKLKDIDIVAGGPPCQPFSLGGKHKGYDDERDMFPHAIKAIRTLTPKAFIFENVKGLLRKSFSSYFNYIILQLTYPEVSLKEGEDWTKHLSRLEKFHTSGKYKQLKYNIVFRLINSADYGVPQKRERVIIVGVRSDLNIEWSFPELTHTEERLLWNKFVTGSYWDLHKVRNKDRETLSKEKQKKIDILKYRYGIFEPVEKPWVTIRDSISDLPDPQKYKGIPAHEFREGARIYPGHNGSYIDEPSKTIKAGGHGVPGGENMVRFPNNEVRYFTVLESKRIQTFPDHFTITGSWTEAMRQLGNAVPVKLGAIIGQSLIDKVAL